LVDLKQRVNIVAVKKILEKYIQSKIFIDRANLFLSFKESN